MARRWLVLYVHAYDALIAAGWSHGIASCLPRYNRDAKPARAGAYAVIESDVDPARHPWGLVPFPPVARAQEIIDGKVSTGQVGLSFDVGERSLFDEGAGEGVSDVS